MTTAYPIYTVVASYDSHNVYDAKLVAKKLKKAGYTGKVWKGLTNKETLDAMGARGLGGYMNPDTYKGQRYLAGYMISNMVVSYLGLKPEGKMGRGSQHRENLIAIRVYEENQNGLV